ncbi:MAG TPA: tyrosine-type recombinase/integrase [Phycisphaerales bacterium]|nr:tyrosine-type recombinase/integrase [Phycisphaerales bacterium]
MGALDRYLEQRDRLHAGLVPREGPAHRSVQSGAEAISGLTLRELVNHFLTAKHRRLESGELGRRSFSDYHATAGRLVKRLGLSRLVEDIDSSDFGALRAALAKTRGPVALSNEIGRIRSIFKHAVDAELVDKPVRFGPEFVKPPKRAIREARRRAGEKLFSPQEIRTLLEAAGIQMRAMILLGLNCGLGNTDIAALTRACLNLNERILDFPRPKTGIARRAVLWSETVEALRLVEENRRVPKSPSDRDRVFITKYGHPWVRVEAPGRQSKGRTQAVVKDAIVLEFGKLVRGAGLYRPRRGFYSLRHTFRTVADEVCDRPAVDLVMGHENGVDVANHYIELIATERLGTIATHVRKALLLGGAYPAE